MGNIKHNNREPYYFEIDKSEYYDFYLDQESDVSPWVIVDDSKYDKVGLGLDRLTFTGLSITPMDKDYVIKNTGHHALDNGLLKLRSDRMSDVEYINKVKEHTITLEKDAFHLERVDTNSKKYEELKNVSIDSDGLINLSGGFYQGSYANDNKNNLLKYITNNHDFFLSLTLNPSCEDGGTSLNNEYGNVGTFFYLGPKSESKLLDFVDDKFNNKNKFENDCDVIGVDVIDWNANPSFIVVDSMKDMYVQPSISEEYVNFNNSYEKYFSDNYIEFEEEEDNNLYFSEDVIDFSLSQDNTKKFELSSEESADHDYAELITKNKFLLFNKTKDGYTVRKWIDSDGENVEHIYQYKKRRDKRNKFQIFHHGKGGYTVKTYLEELQNEKIDYDYVNDLLGNAFSLKVNPDGSISYKYLVRDCDNPNAKYKFEEGHTLPRIVPCGRNNQVLILFRHKKNRIVTDINCPSGYKSFKIEVYVDGYLKYISRDLPSFKFRAYDLPEKLQAGLPYSMSIGGGTMGLSNMIDLEYPLYINEKKELLDTHFAGSFIGKIGHIKLGRI